MAYSNINLGEGVRTMYFYKVNRPTTNSTNISVTEYEVKMEKWKECRNIPSCRETEYYKAIPNQCISVPPVAVSEIGTIYHGTDMVLEKPNKNYYIEKLIEEYKNRAEEARRSVERFEGYVEYLSTI